MEQLQVTRALRPTQQTQVAKPTAFAFLPSEVLIRVFENLCFHCQNPGKFPTADMKNVRQDKATLARLCRVSTRFRDLAQPILYHYYATGNCKHFFDQNDPQIRVFRWQGSNDYLLSFVTTLAARPDLASKVTSLQLVNHSGVYRKYDDDKDLKMLRALIKKSEDQAILSTCRISAGIPV
ncbi:uncharacterized protein PG986_008276 [Apiospora aurea]|uniref:F-box domain-containing protein n=1 Tax=Apiospora aurea TaxID=335848 RepID=A0ABR1QFB2_9PEZI